MHISHYTLFYFVLKKRDIQNTQFKHMITTQKFTQNSINYALKTRRQLAKTKKYSNSKTAKKRLSTHRFCTIQDYFEGLNIYIGVRGSEQDVLPGKLRIKRTQAKQKEGKEVERVVRQRTARAVRDGGGLLRAGILRECAYGSQCKHSIREIRELGLDSLFSGKLLAVVPLPFPIRNCLRLPAGRSSRERDGQTPTTTFHTDITYYRCKVVLNLCGAFGNCVCRLCCQF